jgi:Family of unknown function (DUF6152)
MRTLRKLALGVIGALVAASPLLAHHAWPVDRTKQITVKGTVTAYTWADPHVMIALDVKAVLAATYGRSSEGSSWGIAPS